MANKAVDTLSGDAPETSAVIELSSPRGNGTAATRQPDGVVSSNGGVLGIAKAILPEWIKRWLRGPYYRMLYRRFRLRCNSSAGVEASRRELRQLTRSIPSLSKNGAPCQEEVQRLRTELQAAGMRELPYPFRAAIALASDVDKSTVYRFGKYVGQLVKQHGLDFGDSCWLHWGINSGSAGLGFLTPILTVQKADTFTDGPVFDLYEALREYHKGTFDHLHSLLPRGPRVCVLTDIQRDGRWITARLPKQELTRENDRHLYATFGFWVMGVTVVANDAAPSCVEEVLVEAAGQDLLLDPFRIPGTVLPSRREIDGEELLVFLQHGPSSSRIDRA